MNNDIILNSIKLNYDLDDTYKAPTYEDILKEGFEGSQTLYNFLLNKHEIKRRTRKTRVVINPPNYPAKKYGQKRTDLANQKCTGECFKKIKYHETECYTFDDPPNPIEWDSKNQKTVKNKKIMNKQLISGDFITICKEQLEGFISPSFSVPCFLNAHNIPFTVLITETVKRRCDMISSATHQTFWYPRQYTIEAKYFYQIDQIISDLEPIYNHKVYIWLNPITKKYEYFEHYLIKNFKKLIENKPHGFFIDTRNFNLLFEEENSCISMEEQLHIIVMRIKFEQFMQNEEIFRSQIEEIFRRDGIEVDSQTSIVALLSRLYMIEEDERGNRKYNITYKEKDRIYEAIQYLIYCEQKYKNKHENKNTTN